MSKSLAVLILLLCMHFKSGNCEIPLWSLCTGIADGECLNGNILSGGNTGWYCGGRNFSGFSGAGLYVFIGRIRHGWFIFQETFGDYESLGEVSGGNMSCLRQFGNRLNYSQPMLTLSEGYALRAESFMLQFDESCAQNPCWTSPRRTFYSLVFQGAGSWTIVGRNPNHRICLQASNSSVPYPAVITDLRTLGFDTQDGNIAQIIFGCPGGSGTVLVVDNSRRSVILLYPEV